MTEKLEVIQADREAAWPFASERIRYDPNGSERQRQRWMEGQYDDERVIQAFARHRLSHSRETEALIEALEKIVHLRPFGDVETCKAPRKLVEQMERIALSTMRNKEPK